MLPIRPQNVRWLSGRKDLDLAHGARGFKRPVGVWEKGAEPNILVCGEMLGAFPMLVRGGTAVSSAAPLFCAGAPPQMTRFCGLLSRGLGEKSPDGVAINEPVG